jgi:hypothetical protein
MISTPAEAIAYAQGRAASGAAYPEGNCLGFVRDAYGTGTFGSNAAAQYAATRLRGTTSPPPFGALLWWTGGTYGYGHVGLSDGKGNVYSTDFGADRYYGDGRVRLIPIAAVARYSNPAAPLVFRAWSRDLDGYTVLTEGGEMTDDDITRLVAAIGAALYGNQAKPDPTHPAQLVNIRARLDQVFAVLSTSSPSGLTPDQVRAIVKDELSKAFTAAAAGA